MFFINKNKNIVYNRMKVALHAVHIDYELSDEPITAVLPPSSPAVIM